MVSSAELRGHGDSHHAAGLGIGGLVGALQHVDLVCLFAAYRQPILGLLRRGGTATILGMICWLGRWYNSNGRMTAEQVVRDFVEMVMHGVLKD